MELDVVKQHLAEKLTGNDSYLGLLLSPPGYGKTHLVNEVISEMGSQGFVPIVLDFEKIDPDSFHGDAAGIRKPEGPYFWDDPTTWNDDFLRTLGLEQYHEFIHDEFPRYFFALIIDHLELFPLRVMGTETTPALDHQKYVAKHSRTYSKKGHQILSGLDSGIEYLLSNACHARILAVSDIEAAYDMGLAQDSEAYTGHSYLENTIWGSAQRIVLPEPHDASLAIARNYQLEQKLLFDFPYSPQRNRLLTHTMRARSDVHYDATAGRISTQIFSKEVNHA